jgi:hypothetical protein
MHGSQVPWCVASSIFGRWISMTPALAPTQQQKQQHTQIGLGTQMHLMSVM